MKEVSSHSMTTRGVNVQMPDEMWEDVRGDRTFLKGILWLNQLPLHLEAVAVEKPEDGLLCAMTEEDEDRLRALDEMYSARWNTLEIGGPDGAAPRSYVVYAVPFAG